MVQDTQSDNAGRYPEEFMRAVKRVLADEGGYVRDPADPGGATRYGISQREYPTLDIRDLTREEAVAIYYRDYWRGRSYGELPSAIAGKLFDLAVNMGADHATLCLQRALRACGHAVVRDGSLGPKTVDAALKAPGDALISALRSEAAGYYRLTAERWRLERGESECEFLTGWLNRAYE